MVMARAKVDAEYAAECREMTVGCNWEVAAWLQEIVVP
jgi:hypothetical protein